MPSFPRGSVASWVKQPVLPTLGSAKWPHDFRGMPGFSKRGVALTRLAAECSVTSRCYCVVDNHNDDANGHLEIGIPWGPAMAMLLLLIISYLSLYVTFRALLSGGRKTSSSPFYKGSFESQGRRSGFCMTSAQAFMLWKLNSWAEMLRGPASGSGSSDKDAGDDCDSP